MTLVAKAEKNGKLLEIFVDEDSQNPREWDNLGTMVCWHRNYNLGDEHSYSSSEDFLRELASEHVTTEYLEAKYKEMFGDLTVVENTEIGVNNGTWEIVHKDGRILDTYAIDVSGFETEEEAKDELMYFKINFIGDPEETLEEFFTVGDYIIESSVVILPLYLYDHGEITMSTGRFSCPWDSGQVGWIYCTKERFIAETGYTEAELFSKDTKRTPEVGERVRIEERGDAWGMVRDINSTHTVIDFDYNKSPDFRNPENILVVYPRAIVEVMANRAEEMLEGEVKTFDQYLTGDVYGFVISQVAECGECGHEEKEHLDSCWGFYGRDWNNNGMAGHIEEPELLELLEDVY